jgi:hypothetical protein
VRKLLIVPLVMMLAFAFAPANAAPVGGYVGYLGCSQTKNAVHGYQAIGGKRFWPVIGVYGGGSIQAWAARIGPSDGRWAAFMYYLANEHPTEIWVQWCTKTSENHSLDLAASIKVLNEVHHLAPLVPVFVSAQNDYVIPHYCQISGPDGPRRMQLIALQDVLRAKAHKGPDVGSLRSKYQNPSIIKGDQTVPDGCHANEAGAREVLGPALRAFFG